jgi:hypothetical protein
MGRMCGVLAIATLRGEGVVLAGRAGLLRAGFSAGLEAGRGAGRGIERAVLLAGEACSDDIAKRGSMAKEKGYDPLMDLLACVLRVDLFFVDLFFVDLFFVDLFFVDFFFVDLFLGLFLVDLPLDLLELLFWGRRLDDVLFRPIRPRAGTRFMIIPLETTPRKSQSDFGMI